MDRQRPGHVEAQRLETILEENRAVCLFAWHTLLIVEHVGAKVFGKEAIQEILKEMLGSLVVPRTGTEAALKAFQYPGGDYEDAMQIAAAVFGNADWLVTSDKAAYGKSPIEVVGAAELVRLLTD